MSTVCSLLLALLKISVTRLFPFTGLITNICPPSVPCYWPDCNYLSTVWSLLMAWLQISVHRLFTATGLIANICPPSVLCYWPDCKYLSTICSLLLAWLQISVHHLFSATGLIANICPPSVPCPRLLSVWVSLHQQGSHLISCIVPGVSSHKSETLDTVKDWALDTSHPTLLE